MTLFKASVLWLPVWTTGISYLPLQPKVAGCCTVWNSLLSLHWRFQMQPTEDFLSSPSHWSQVGQSQKGCAVGKEAESHRALAERTAHQCYVCLQASAAVKHNKQVAIFFQSYLKMFPKSVSTASQNAWYFVMPQTLTLTDTRNPTGNFIHLQWKHDVFNSKDVSITFRDFFHFGSAVLWQIAK